MGENGMMDRTLSPRSNAKSGTAVLIMLLVALLAAGYLIGSALNALAQTPPDSASVEASRPTGGAIVNPPYRVQDFTLTSHTGEAMSLSDLRGQAVVMFFGYTHCPDVCPTTLADYRRVKEALGDEAAGVKFVFISVDGARDTPEVLAHYLGQFDPDFIGMTGDEATLRQMGAEYGLLFQQETISVDHEHEDGYEHEHAEDLDVENYFVEHTSPSFLIDPDGYLRLVYFYGTNTDAIAEGIRQVLG
jgi:protein SCO1/2